MYHTESTFVSACSWVEIHAAETQAAATEPGGNKNAFL